MKMKWFVMRLNNSMPIVASSKGFVNTWPKLQQRSVSYMEEYWVVCDSNQTDFFFFQNSHFRLFL